MNTSRGFAPLVLIIIIGLGILGGAGWWYTNKPVAPKEISNEHSNPSQTPSCTVTSNTTQVTSLDQKIKVTWSSENATVVKADYPVDPYGYDLPPQGSGTIAVRGGVSFMEEKPAQVNLRFTVSNTQGGNVCDLTLPYGSNFVASPREGGGPLTVIFTGPTFSEAKDYVDFGDGSRAFCSEGDCPTLPLRHTYKTAGTYTAVWSQLKGGAAGQTYGTVKITVY